MRACSYGLKASTWSLGTLATVDIEFFDTLPALAEELDMITTDKSPECRASIQASA
jgi:hypothetical protein